MLSVVIPCFNNGALLAELLDCCLRQTYDDWEVLVVDDGSTDNTVQIVREYVSRDPRVKFLQRDREPKGGDTCRNIGLDNSRGEYICFFDADDLIVDTCFESRVKFFEAHRDFDYISFPAKSFVGRGKLPDFHTRGKTWGVGDVRNDLKSLLTAEYQFAVWCNVYRSESLRSKKIRWDENVFVYQDFDFMLSCVFSGLRHSYSNTGKVDYFYRTTPDSVSSNFVSDLKCKSTLYLFNKVLMVLQNESGAKRLKKWFSSFVSLHFERLCKDGSDFKINEFIELVQKFYGDKYAKHLEVIYAFLKRHPKFNVKAAVLLGERKYFKLLKCILYKCIRMILG